MPRLTNDDFVALRSLQMSNWRDDHVIMWKHNGRWFGIYPTSPPWVHRYREKALDAADRLIEMGLVARSAETCCADHYGTPIHKLTSCGAAFIKRADEALPTRTAKRDGIGTTKKKMADVPYGLGLLRRIVSLFIMFRERKSQ